MPANRPVVRLLQAAAAIVFGLGMVLCLLCLAVAQGKSNSSLEAMLDSIGPGVGYLMLGGGLGAALVGLASLLQRRQELPRQLFDALDRLEQSVQALQQQLAAGAQAGGEPDQTQRPALPPEAIEPVSPPVQHDAPEMRQMMELLEELRQVSLMTPQQRQERQARELEQHKAALLEQARELLRTRQWAKTDELLAGLERQYPADAAIARTRQEFQAARATAETETFASMSQQAENAMAIGEWDRAYELAMAFVDDFPHNADGQAYLARVVRERDLFRENTAGRMYDEAKYEIEHRNWRRALAASQRLLEKFPDHAKAQRIRSQIKLIGENAEIEERQEQEQRIQELIRSKRYGEAVDLGEDLMRRFPLSPQAAAVERLLPKLRQRAIQQETGSR